MDFEPAEYQRRTERAQTLMRAKGLDALFLTTEPEVRYFSGFRTLFWQSPTRPWYLVVPAVGKPIAIIPEIGAPLMQKTWIDDIRCWASPAESDDGVSQLKLTLKDYPRVGVAMGRESHLRMPVNDFQKLRLELTGTRFVDATALLNAVRFVKSDAEIATLWQICSIASNAFDKASLLFHEGQSLDQVFRTFKMELLSLGAEEVPYVVGGKGPLGYRDVISPPTTTPLDVGDVLMLDTGSTLRGYFCDFDRNFSIGRPDDAVRRAYETLWLATEAGLAAARPGARCSDVFHAMQNVIGPTPGNVGRLGHGLGIELTETPSLIAWDHTELKEGAVITLEPSMVVADGYMMVQEENIVIRDGAPQLLTRRAPRELPML